MIDLQSLKPGDRVFKRAVNVEVAKYPIHEYEYLGERNEWAFFYSLQGGNRAHLPIEDFDRPLSPCESVWGRENRRELKAIDLYWFHTREEAEASIQAERERKIAYAERSIERAKRRLETLTADTR